MRSARTAIIFFMAVISLIGGCQTNDANQGAFGSTQEPVYAEVPQQDAKRMKEELERMKEVDAVTAVQIDNEVYITLTVTGFDRLFLKKIRKGAHERAKKLNQDAVVHVSTDKKINRDLSRLESSVNDRTITKEELKKKLDKADKDMKG
ncbi:YhcN/YlaJ family sporulation lipoprotein [Evansella clarkii]|uniref:YhcN/YlaJ family sporulation lipoprotein n=1 Tax=Evansella clarkii TaxID=79879 RepID=UPI000997AEE2|nr:YhcN/YlaJ family sporulation lipoprotein [Evansella clarkii]